jgi:hypothetical protein
MTWLTAVAPVLKAQIEAQVLDAPLVSPVKEFKSRWRDEKATYVHPVVRAELTLQVTAIRDVTDQALYTEPTFALAGNPALTYAAAGRTITRSAGSWLTEGFRAGVRITSAGTVSNNFTGALVSAVTATVITLDSQALVNEGPVSNVTITAPELIRTIEGMRILTLQIQAISHNQAVAFWGQETLERLVTRLDKQSVNDALKAVNCGIIDRSPITLIPNVKVDDRLLSVASVDLFVCAGFTDTDGSEVVGYFDKIELTGKLENPGGVEYPSSLNPQAVLIPPGV